MPRAVDRCYRKEPFPHDRARAVSFGSGIGKWLSGQIPNPQCAVNTTSLNPDALVWLERYGKSVGLSTFGLSRIAVTNDDGVDARLDPCQNRVRLHQV